MFLSRKNHHQAEQQVVLYEKTHHSKFREVQSHDSCFGAILQETIGHEAGYTLTQEHEDPYYL
jgi:hypothetical protein